MSLALVLGSSCLACLARFEVGDASASETQSASDTDAGTSTAGSADAGSESGSAEGGCDPDQLACDGACVDPQTDPANCGICGHDCNPDESCESGSCIDSCAPACDPILELCVGGECACRDELGPCGGICVDLQSDPQHCGSCTMECEGELCQGGECVSECEQDKVDCDGSCVDLDENPLHCGACETACGGDELCVGGECYGYTPSDCNTDLDCDVGVCCEVDEDKVCVNGEQCP